MKIDHIIVLFVIAFFSVSHAANLSDSQLQAIDRIIEWMSDHHGRAPLPREFGSHRIPLAYESLTSTIFPDSPAFWRALKRAAREHGMRIHLQDVQLHEREFSADWRKSLQDEALDIVFSWVRKNGLWPRRTDFRNLGGSVPIDFSRLVGRGYYNRSKPSYIKRIFDSPEAYRQAVAERWQNHPRKEDLPSPPLRMVWPKKKAQIRGPRDDFERAGANELVFQWMERYQRIPVKKDFGLAPDQIPLNYHRLMGQGDYAPGRGYEHLSYYPSKQSFWLQFASFAATKEFSFHLLDVNFRSPLEPGIKLLLREEALDLIASWMSRTRIYNPTRDDFTNRDLELPINPKRLFQSGKESIFDSFEELESVLAERSKRLLFQSCSNLIAEPSRP